MDTFFTILAVGTLGILFYVYIGYPVLLGILSLLFPARPLKKRSIQPSVSLLISCYNEEAILEKKLRNSISLNYPSDKIEILVVSDGSTDRTDTIVKNFADKGIKLIRVEGRVGKTACLNVAVPQATGEIIVFSDANAMYAPDAISRLVENFADDQVGYVVGEARYTDADCNAAAKSEGSYWQYEIMIKKMESRLHSVVGADGAIYAIRKELYWELQASDINDFVNPLQIISRGYRGVYEPQAICYEETAGSFAKEFDRKTRIVNRSFNGLLRVKSVLNPFKVGIYSFEIISHKLLRWLAPYFLLLFVLSSVVLAMHGNAFFQYVTLFIAIFVVLADIGHLLSSYSKIWPIFYIPYYFIRVNIAAFIGINRRLLGDTQVTWTPPRVEEKEQEGVSWGGEIAQIVVIGCLFYVLWFVNSVLPVDIDISRIVFLSALCLIVYVYFGYPVILAVWSKCCPKAVNRDEIFPEATLLICAYNEEEVIEDKILNSLQIDYPKEKLHIVIASDGSSDNTISIAEKYAGSRLTLYAYQERTGKIGAILQTIPKITSEIIIFSDANTMYEPNALRTLIRNFNDPSVGGVSADVVLLNDETNFGESESAYYRYERWIQQKESEVGSIIGADGGMYAIRRELFKPPAPNIILDDFVISMNVALQGKRLVYDAGAKGYEKSTISHVTEFLRKSRVIAGAVQALKQAEGIPGPSHKGLFFSFVSHKMLRWLAPVMLLALLFSNIYIAIHGGTLIYLFFLLLQIVFYFLAFAGLVLGGEGKTPIIGIPFYFCLVNGAALYGLYKGCLNKQPVTWKKFSRK